MHWRSPESGGLWYKSSRLKKTICRDVGREAELERARGVTFPVNPAPCTLHPAPHTPHPTPHTQHPTPYNLHPQPYTSRPPPDGRSSESRAPPRSTCPSLSSGSYHARVQKVVDVFLAPATRGQKSAHLKSWMVKFAPVTET